MSDTLADMNEPLSGPGDAVGEPGPAPLQPYRPSAELDPEMRQRALQRLEAKKGFRQHLAVYGCVMALLTCIWLVTGGLGSYFWPIWPMMGWGVGIAIHGATMALDKEPTEQQIAEESARLRKRLGRPDHPED